VNVASLFNLAGPDLIFILLIVLLLFGARRSSDRMDGLKEAARQFWKASRRWGQKGENPEEDPSSPIDVVNEALFVLAIALLLLACGMGFFGGDL
jgi:sec-independent protein translocase protein TatA